ncbi:MAG: hypothetical protein ABF883_02930 [Acetobacter sp.]|uniref:hypothetical protein n=1 Tax=Acetobacter sp. TaxID=440 RepID=UPI0039EC6480
MLRRYDSDKTLFYLDPPYWGCERDYNAPFSRDQFTEMAEWLGRIKGRFILSLNDRPEVREVFAAFDIEAVKVNYSVSSKGAGRGARGEVLISN